MKRVIITLSSQDSSPNMKELNNSELQLTKEEDRRVISPTKIENHSIKPQNTGDFVTTQNSNNTSKSHIQDDELKCMNCGNVDGSREKELEAKNLEIEELKTKLEDELFERIRIEEEFTTEREILEREILTLRDRIEELEREATWKVDDLDAKYETAQDEISQLKCVLERTVSENVKLRNEMSATDDREMEILDELELWKRKALENAEKGDASKSVLQAEIDLNEKEIIELKETLMENKCTINEMRRHSQQLSQEVTRFKCHQADDSIEQSDTEPRKTNTEVQFASKEKRIVELSTELNDLYRDHVDYQEKFLSLHQNFISQEKELDDVRGEYESQNIEIQNYKERNAELKDVVLATCQENSHLKNRLDKKVEDFKDLTKQHLVLETEVKWLREALGIIKT